MTKPVVKSKPPTLVTLAHKIPSKSATSKVWGGFTSKVAHCKLYNTKTPITAADILNDRVLPFYEVNGLPVLRILTDRGTKYCGKVEQHDYQLYLAINDIDHTKTKAMSTQTNGICEWFHLCPWV